MAKSQKVFISMSSISPIPHDDELCNWEFVNQSDCNYDVISDDDAVFDVQSFDLDESVHSLSDQDDDVDDAVDDVVDDDVDQVEEKKDAPIIEETAKIAVKLTKLDDFNVNLTNCAVNYRDYDVERYDDHHDDDEHDEEDEEDDDGDDGNDMDDDLVPWEVKGLYMRERIKKSEKKSLTKMIKSKKPLVRSVRGRFGQYHAVKAY